MFHTDRPDPFWNNVGQCDGSAAVVEYGSYLFQMTGDLRWWELAGEGTILLCVILSA